MTNLSFVHGDFKSHPMNIKSCPNIGKAVSLKNVRQALNCRHNLVNFGKKMQSQALKCRPNGYKSPNLVTLIMTDRVVRPQSITKWGHGGGLLVSLNAFNFDDSSSYPTGITLQLTPRFKMKGDEKATGVMIHFVKGRRYVKSHLKKLQIIFLLNVSVHFIRDVDFS